MHGYASKTPGLFLKRCFDLNGQVQSLRIATYRSSHSSDLRLREREREMVDWSVKSASDCFRSHDFSS